MPPDAALTAHSAPGPMPAEVADYVAVIRRRWLTVLVTVTLSGLVGAAWHSTRPVVYEASADVLVLPLTRDPLDEAARRTINIPAEIELARSPGVTALAAWATDSPSDEFAASARVAGDAEAEILRFRYAAADPATAQARVAAHADAYLERRNERGRAAVAASSARLEQQIGTLREQLDQIGEQISVLTAEEAPSRELAAAQSEQALLTSQMSMLFNELATRSLVNVNGGELLRPPTRPSQPVGPGRTQVLVLALGMGLLVGLILAFMRDRLDPRVFGSADAAATSGVPVVDDRTSTGSQAERRDPGRLLALRVRGLRQPGTVRVTAVTGVGNPDHAREVAAGLGRMLARRSPVLVVDAAGGRPDGTVTDAPHQSAWQHAFLDATDPVNVAEELTELLRDAAQQFEHVVLLAPPAHRSLTLLECSEVLDEVFVVVDQHGTRRRALAQVVSHLAGNDVPVAGLVLYRRSWRPRTWQRRQLHDRLEPNATTAKPSNAVAGATPEAVAHD